MKTNPWDDAVWLFIAFMMLVAAGALIYGFVLIILAGKGLLLLAICGPAALLMFFFIMSARWNKRNRSSTRT